MTSAFIPILRGSSAPTIVNVTSGPGSFAAVHDQERSTWPLAAAAAPPARSSTAPASPPSSAKNRSMTQTGTAARTQHSFLASGWQALMSVSVDECLSR